MKRESKNLGNWCVRRQVSGIPKGYFATVTMKTDATTQVGYKKELFAVSSDYAASAY